MHTLSCSGSEHAPLSRLVDSGLNLAAFVEPSGGRWGAAGRNTARGSGLVWVDLALHRIFWLGEKSRLTFRAESFKLFNPAQQGNPSSNISTPATFGQIRSPLNRMIGTGGSGSRRIRLAPHLSSWSADRSAGPVRRRSSQANGAEGAHQFRGCLMWARPWKIGARFAHPQIKQ